MAEEGAEQSIAHQGSWTGGSGIGPGAVLADRYRIDSVVGRGGMATVYLGHDRLLDRDVAVKVLGSFAASATGSNQEFLHEARASAALSHANIVGVYDAGVHGNERYIVMEFVGGGSLFEEIQSAAPMAPEHAIAIATQLADALDYGHRHGIVHCDVKPQNVLMDENGHPKLVDFGISSSIAATGALTETVTGTAGYIAPEQLLGEHLDGRADIYSLGCLIYEMLSGDLPFEAANLAALATQRLVRAPIPLSDRNPKLSSPLVGAVMRALEREPDRRYSTAKEFADALNRASGAGASSGAEDQRTILIRRQREPAIHHRVQTRTMERPTGVAADTPSRGSLFWPLTLIALILLFAVGALIALLLPSLSGSSGQPVTVPAVTNQRVDQAAQTLHSQGLTVDVQQQDSPSCFGTVLSQSPAPSTQTSKGATVTLTYSRNAQQC